MKTESNIRVKIATSALQEIRNLREEEKNKRRPLQLDERSFSRLIPTRSKYGNKGTFGKVLIIAGSRNMAGAAILAARSAFAAGCGMVMILTDDCNRTILQMAVPEALLATYDGQIDEEVFEDAIDWCSCILIGPGLSTGDEARQLVDMVLDETVTKPIVLDADALNILAVESNAMRMAGKNVIITPHVGEVARLVGLSIREIQSHMIETAEAFSTHHNVTVILKDAISVISSPGRRSYENHSGNNGMATAGSGDVLAGLVTGLVATGAKNADAAIVGAYIHGLAGDYAAREKTPYCMTASDIIAHFPDVFFKAMNNRHSGNH